jgi:NAD-dependent DNA ligase
MLETLQLRADHPWQAQLIAFTGDSTFRLNGFPLDRNACTVFAEHAGMHVHPRVTKKVQLLVDCDVAGVSGNEAKADHYGILVISEREFWAAIGLPVEQVAWHEVRRRPAEWTRTP